MKKGIITGLILLIMGTFISVSFASEQASNNTIIISNKYFSISLPSNVKKEFSVKKKKNGIFIYDKTSAKAGFGGFAFGVKPYEKPSEHSMIPGGR